MTHTPGPWYAHYWTGGLGSWYVSTSSVPKDERGFDDLLTIARVDWKRYNVNEHNARLIAAAPEMFKALVLLVIAQNGRDFDAAYTVGDYHEDVAAAANLARSILDRIKGAK